MTRRLSRLIGYLFIPEEIPFEDRLHLPVARRGKKHTAKVSFKAIFWAGVAVGAALMLGRLS